MAKLESVISWVAMLVVIAVALIYINSQYEVVPQILPERVGSITTGQEYKATTTAFWVNQFDGWDDRVIKRGSGSLGSVIVTKAGDIEYSLFDATSTAALNAEGFVTSTHLLASITTNLAAGTYTFDVEFIDGLVLEVLQGTTGTSTISYR
jgi:hypothetical protein